MIGVGKFKSHELRIVEVVDHHPIDAVIIMSEAVSGEIQIVVLGKAQVQLKGKVQVHKIGIVPLVIIARTADEY